MNDKYVNRYSMFNRVHSFLVQEDTVVSTIPAFKSGVTQLGEYLAAISSLDSGKDSLTDGKGTAKLEAKGELAKAIYDVAAALCIYAVDNSLPDLKENMDVSESSLKKMRDMNLVNKAKDILSKTSGLETALADYGLTADEVTEANNKLTALESAMDAMGEGMEKSIAATKSLAQLMHETGELIDDKLDRFADRMQTKNIDFYNTYYATRRVIDLGAGIKKDEPAETTTQQT